MNIDYGLGASWDEYTNRQEYSYPQAMYTGTYFAEAPDPTEIISSVIAYFNSVMRDFDIRYLETESKIDPFNIKFTLVPKTNHLCTKHIEKITFERINKNDTGTNIFTFTVITNNVGANNQAIIHTLCVNKTNGVCEVMTGGNKIAQDNSMKAIKNFISVQIDGSSLVRLYLIQDK